ncbi:glycosyltransferase family 4 protein [Flavivirga sp. 57AJ16]|uniref:glycosyltransferase family 4 protein n=1 Tax=Flavivirga sp. 57AJ16 TaxID=3025307 RepID=UPI002365B88C|nr:glycosyltransferase family 4 protein [Flavivirga sp. 57AJ16]MDD7886239.1 glycosyltransferase family 4 protein [Flavivirga sp. 57AJ16]
MKVLHCINSPQIGGIERLVIDLAIEQKKQGIEVAIILDTREGQYYEYLLNQNIPILDSGIKNGFCLNYKTFKQLKRSFKAFQIIHLHNFSFMRSIAAKYSKVKTIYTVHGLSKEVRKESVLKYFIRELVKKRLLNTVSIVIANSHFTLGLAKKHYGLEKVKNQVILNGIRLADYSLNTVSGTSEFTIGLVSRFTERKRIDRLILAFKAYKKKGGLGKLILVGGGFEFNRIQNMVNNFNIEDSVKLLGYKKDVAAYYNDFDVVVYPSENEPFGLAAVEAYLHGKPVIVFKDSGGLKEVVAPLEPENIVLNKEELVNRLLFYVQHRDQITATASKRINYAKENFGIERMERDYYSLYKNI